MVISKKIDYRKHKKRDVFFGMPFLPLLVFLLLIIALLVLPPDNPGKFLVEKEDGIRKVSAPVAFEVPVTGEVVGGTNLTKVNYEVGKSLEGNYIIRFYPGDLIPPNSVVNFSITSIKCNHSYVCSFGDVVRWQVYNKTLARCVNVTDEGWTNAPWTDICLENYGTYPCGTNRSCCNPGYGQGKFYANLNCTGGKECWDKCASVTSNRLVDLVAKSTKPYGGNYSQGNYSNVNASAGQQLSGYGWGFSYCQSGGILRIPSGYAVYSQDHYPLDYVTDYVTGYQTLPVTDQDYQTLSGQIPIDMPDLTISRIYVSTEAAPPDSAIPFVMGQSAGAVPSKQKIYATINNLGARIPSGFYVVLACWHFPEEMLVLPECDSQGNLISVPSNCRNKTLYYNSRLPYEFEINEVNAIFSRILTIKVDYCRKINERNENNNENIGYVGCYDPDSQQSENEIYVKGTCTDLNGTRNDYCNVNTDPPRLVEMRCSGTGIPGTLPYCMEVSLSCPSGYFCSNGACIQQTLNCRDSDDGKNEFVFGTCTDMMPMNRNDECVDANKVREWYCKMPEDFCANEIIQCPANMVCLNGICTRPPKPDLIIEKIERTADFKKALITIKNNGTSSVTVPFKLMINITIGTDVTTEVHNITTLLGPGNTAQKSSDKIIEGMPASVSVYADIYNEVDESNENNNYASAVLLPYSCELWNWSNVYIISLGSAGLNLKAPDVEGNYTLNVSFTYDDKIISKESLFINAYKPVVYYYKGCLNNQCVTKNSSSPRNDTCSSNADCRGISGCIESWKFTSFTECLQGKKQRECYDANACGTTDLKPTYCLPVGNKFIEIQDCCVQAWSCDEWSACYERQGALIQSQICSDLNRCNAQNFSYTQLRECCLEEWQCTWGPCINGLETLTCQELSGCGTNFTKPQEQTRVCKIEKKVAISWWVVLVIIGAVVVVTIVILFATNAIKLPKKAKAIEETSADTETYPELINYIKNAIAVGISKDEIKRKLVEAGWPEDIINLELKKF